MNNETIFNKSKEVAARIIEGEAVIISPSEGDVRVLNEVGSRIWELIDGTNTVEKIFTTISDEFEVSLDDARTDALEFFSDLVNMKLIY